MSTSDDKAAPVTPDGAPAKRTARPSGAADSGSEATASGADDSPAVKRKTKVESKARVKSKAKAKTKAKVKSKAKAKAARAKKKTTKVSAEPSDAGATAPAVDDVPPAAPRGAGRKVAARSTARRASSRERSSTRTEPVATDAPAESRADPPAEAAEARETERPVAAGLSAASARASASAPPEKSSPAPETAALEEVPVVAAADVSLVRPAAPAPVEEPSPRVFPRPGHAVFIDVENTSSEASLAGVLDEIGLEGLGTSMEVIAVGNWRVIAQGLARSLAARGVQLVHTAPEARVRDWSDLWIAVHAGIWLGRAGAGDTLEVVSHDRAFDAIGDAARRLGVKFRRITYGRGTGNADAAGKRRPAGGGSGRRRGGRGGAGRGSGRSREPSAAAADAQPDSPPAAAAGVEEHDRHAATPRQILAVLRRLTAEDPAAGAAIDWLTDELKAAGFHRPPGSPRLITRLKRIKDIEVLANGRIRLASASHDHSAADVAPEEPAPTDGNGAESAEAPGAPAPRRRSRRRGGRRRGGSRQESPDSPEAAGTQARDDADAAPRDEG